MLPHHGSQSRALSLRETTFPDTIMQLEMLGRLSNVRFCKEAQEITSRTKRRWHKKMQIKISLLHKIKLPKLMRLMVKTQTVPQHKHELLSLLRDLDPLQILSESTYATIGQATRMDKRETMKPSKEHGLSGFSVLDSQELRMLRKGSKKAQTKAQFDSDFLMPKEIKVRDSMRSVQDKSKETLTLLKSAGGTCESYFLILIEK